MKFEIEGLSELQNKLSRLAGSVTTGNVVTEGLLEGAKMIQATAQDKAPKDEGHLRNSITIKAVDTGIVDIGTNLEYSVYVEYGTGNLTAPGMQGTTKKHWFVSSEDMDERTAQKYHYPKITTKSGKVFYMVRPQPPHPYMYPALQAHKDDVVRILREHLQKAVDGHG